MMVKYFNHFATQQTHTHTHTHTGVNDLPLENNRLNIPAIASMSVVDSSGNNGRVKDVMKSISLGIQ